MAHLFYPSTLVKFFSSFFSLNIITNAVFISMFSLFFAYETSNGSISDSAIGDEGGLIASSCLSTLGA
jgi:hypothetical protein